MYKCSVTPPHVCGVRGGRTSHRQTMNTKPHACFTFTCANERMGNMHDNSTLMRLTREGEAAGRHKRHILGLPFKVKHQMKLTTRGRGIPALGITQGLIPMSHRALSLSLEAFP